MNSVVAIEPFRHQSLRRASHRKFVIGDLVLDNDVNDGVHLSFGKLMPARRC
jgi:hypothetical protein